MLDIRTGVVTRVEDLGCGLQELMVAVDGQFALALNYTALLGKAKIGDQLRLNTTAVKLGLGTGGYHFVIDNLNQEAADSIGLGHIMKLRYTPMQIRTLSVEEEGSPFHEAMQNAESMEHTPVVILSLHSQLIPVVAAIKANAPLARISYIMTDSAALPLALSHNVRLLNSLKVLEGTISAGQAFGGDLEAVNNYSALLAARHVQKAEIIVIGMGPGVVGTDTRWGFSGIEQGELVNTVELLEGIPIAVPRISFADNRKRHQGLSHHTITALGRVARAKAWVPLPELEGDKRKILQAQLDQSGLAEKHSLLFIKESKALKKMAAWGVNPSTMGRNIEQDTEFFLAAAAAGRLAAELNNINAVFSQ